MRYTPFMKDLKTIRWGIVGTGHIARQFASDISLAKATRLTAVAARDQTKADSFAASLSGVTGFGSIEAMIHTGLVDAIYIATPNTVHHAQALECIAKGTPVLVEKPLAASLADATAIKSAASAAGVFAMEALWSRYLPAIQAARQAVRSGAIGKLKRFEADLGWKLEYDPHSRFFNRTLGGGVLHDLGVYPISMARFFLGEPDHVEGSWQAAPSGVDISARLRLRFAGTEALITCAFDRDGSNRLTIEGDRGVIVLGPLFIKADCFAVYPSRLFADLAQPGGNSVSQRIRRKLFRHLPLPRVTHHPHPFEGNGLQFEIEAASNAIRLGQLEQSDNKLSDTLATLRIIDDILNLPPETA